VLAAAPHLLAPSAQAQVAFSAAVDSDDRYRGVSLSAAEPTLSFGASYDHASGAYGGVTGIAVATRHAGWQALGYVAYLGYAGRLEPGTSWDVGVTNSQDMVYLYKHYVTNYTEIYAGYSRNNLSAHVYYSPNYLSDSSTLYFELDGAVRPARGWRLFGHAGVLEPLDAERRRYAPPTRFDLRIGVARELRHSEISLAWTTTTPAPRYPQGVPQSRDALVVGASYHF